VGLFTAMEISGSGMTAERLRLDVIASNLANAETTRTPQGGPYRRRLVVMAPRYGGSFRSVLEAFRRGAGGYVPAGTRVVGIIADPSPFKTRYDPHHPDAGPDGYVRYPNVEVVQEMVDLITATRAYEANATALAAFKTMFQKALELGRR